MSEQRDVLLDIDEENMRRDIDTQTAEVLANCAAEIRRLRAENERLAASREEQRKEALRYACGNGLQRHVLDDIDRRMGGLDSLCDVLDAKEALAAEVLSLRAEVERLRDSSRITDAFANSAWGRLNEYDGGAHWDNKVWIDVVSAVIDEWRNIHEESPNA